MATFLRPLSYKYQWIYDTISRVAAIPVGGESKFRQLALENLAINNDSRILDLCCGKGQSTKFLVNYSQDVTGLDASVYALEKARQNVPQANYLEGLAQKLPFDDRTFDIVHTSVALHEMTLPELEEILREVYRVLKAQGIFTFVDLHKPSNLLFMPSLAMFMWLFETETAWQFINTDVSEKLSEAHFQVIKKKLYAGGSLQVIQAQKLS
jgi:demethylmenaquinone methyltransferase/2-methoxy-6-polyprenyl-1,4-benzoquinol methylase